MEEGERAPWGDASELMSLIPVLGHYLESVLSPRGLLTLEIASFRALALIYASVREGKLGGSKRIGHPQACVLRACPQILCSVPDAALHS